MSEFKNMKFWMGGDGDISTSVQLILLEQGYSWGMSENKPRYIGSNYICSYADGALGWGGAKASFDECKYEEINIDWMRTKKPETIELNGKTYVKTELEEALRNIKPVE